MTRLERVGDRGRFPTDIRTRILESIVRTDAGCWEWTKTLSPLGYGRMAVGSRADGTRRLTTPHRASYEAFVGPIPDGLVIDHLCRNPPCCNPAHLEPVSQRTNVLRGDAPSAQHAKQTHCLRGHELTPENTANSSDGHRRCKECNRRRAAESKARRAK